MGLFDFLIPKKSIDDEYQSFIDMSASKVKLAEDAIASLRDNKDGHTELPPSNRSIQGLRE